MSLLTLHFKTRPQMFYFQLGDTVKLPCEVDNKDVILIWEKDDRLLYQGDVRLNFDQNIKLNGGNLEVTILSDNDYGKYSCNMAINGHPKIIHTIAKPTKPHSIESIDNKVTYQVDDTLKLTCNADGNPQPKITWYKNNKRLDVSGNTLIIEKLKLGDAGTYRCLADNKIEPPAHHNIIIYIQHKPVMTINNYIVNSANENDAELKCTVHAYPAATVSWKRDGTNIISNPPKTNVKLHQNNGKVENILIITNLTDSDFGEYICSAKNDLGKEEKSIYIDVVLTWRVESKSPIQEHELQHRKSSEEEWKNLVPEIIKEGGNVHTVKYTLKGPDAGTYEVRLRSRNNHGWSDYSDVITVKEEEAHITTICDNGIWMQLTRISSTFDWCSYSNIIMLLQTVNIIKKLCTLKSFITSVAYNMEIPKYLIRIVYKDIVDKFNIHVTFYLFFNIFM
ncbi:hypothetical protein NQ317_018136 [Molorchus minor]|uniref:Ig-like domain-containing protein n=1 Tax=Molorchus minor TaxID=1323400 RepID=A0ABQ9IXF8_9CUCU|nr:hypothetical protein NQ317_018136 [Molorchus minor]